MIPRQRFVDAGLSTVQGDPVKAMKGRGCDRCGGTGYKGRVGLFEVMEMSDALRELVLNGAPATELRRVAMSEGMSTLRQSGLKKVVEGLSSMEEVVRETME